jgi:enoyl-CoA hydratase/carnithine racemase
MSEILHSSLHGRVLRLTLHRPEKRNALNPQLCRELVAAFETAADDRRVGAILLAGEGKTFCAGMDLSEVDQADTDEIDQAHEQLFTVGASLPKPLIAAVHGGVYGGGVGLVANCHIAIAAEGAQFGLTEIRLGLWPFLVYRAVESALGERRTLELALTGRLIGAAEARDIGLIHEVAADLESRAAAVAEGVAESSPTAIRSGMAFVQEVRGRNWNEAGGVARRVRNQVFASPDFREGLRAFREKRAAKWPSLE